MKKVCEKQVFKMVRDMTEGKPSSLILRFCLPLMAGNLFQQFYNMVDSIIVGRFVGKDALSAMGCVGSLHFLVIGSIIGLCTGFAIPVSQCFGANDFAKMRKYIANLVYLSAVISVFVSLLTYFGTEWLLRVLNTPEALIPDAKTYISIFFLGIPATVLYNSVACLIRAVGDSKTPLYFLIFSSVINIGLDLLFVIQFGMGVMGVAVATVIAQALSGILCLDYIHRSVPLLHLQKGDMRPNTECCQKLLYAGLPMALQFSITAIGSVMLQSCVNELGSDAIAAMTIAGKTQLIIVLPAETIGLTLATFCGQNLGAKRVDRISQGTRNGLCMAFVYSVIGAVIARCFGRYIMMLFISASETVVLDYGMQFLRINSALYAVLVIIFVLRNALQGMGFSIPAMTAGLFELIARGTVGFVFVRRFGYAAACWANPAAWFAADLFLIPMYLYVMHKFKTVPDFLRIRSEKSYE